MRDKPKKGLSTHWVMVVNRSHGGRVWIPDIHPTSLGGYRAGNGEL
jgi:hypothetical protein